MPGRAHQFEAGALSERDAVTHQELHSPYPENILYELWTLEDKKRNNSLQEIELRALLDELDQVETEQAQGEKVKLDELRLLPRDITDIAPNDSVAEELSERMARLLERIEAAINEYAQATRQHRFISLRYQHMSNGVERLDQANRSRSSAHEQLLDGLRTVDTLGTSIVPAELHLTGPKRDEWKRRFSGHMLPQQDLSPDNNPGRERIGRWAIKMTILEQAKRLEAEIELDLSAKVA